MSVLIEIGHPAHVHFYHGFLRELKKKKIDVTVVTRDKEITNQLLDRLDIPYTCLSTPGKGPIALGMELLSRWKQIYGLIRSRDIKLATSISGISTSVPARLSGIKNVMFTDNEDSTLTNFIAGPFADEILTPTFFLKKLGPKHKRYVGLHELCYLQDFDFDAAQNVRQELKLPDKYLILRLVSNSALHDWNTKDLQTKDIHRLITKLEKYGKVLITSQNELPPSLVPYQIKVPLEHIHAVLSGAQMFVGDSPTMAVESSLLGTPAFLVSNRIPHLGNMIHLERDFSLLKNFTNLDALEFTLQSLTQMGEIKMNWRDRAQTFRQSMPDMNHFITNTLLNSLLGGRSQCAA